MNNGLVVCNPRHFPQVPPQSQGLHICRQFGYRAGFHRRMQHMNAMHLKRTHQAGLRHVRQQQATIFLVCLIFCRIQQEVPLHSALRSAALQGQCADCATSAAVSCLLEHTGRLLFRAHVHMAPVKPAQPMIPLWTANALHCGERPTYGDIFMVRAEFLNTVCIN